MRTNHLAILGAALALVVGSLAFAGCGGGAAKSSAAETVASEPVADVSASTMDAEESTFAVDDCTMLTAIAMDLGLLDGFGSGFDYASDREFMDGYANRAPGGVAESARRVRDILDRFASAAEDAGLAADADPTEDQIDQISSAMEYSDDEQAENAEAVTQLVVYAGTSC